MYSKLSQGAFPVFEEVNNSIITIVELSNNIGIVSYLRIIVSVVVILFFRVQRKSVLEPAIRQTVASMY